MSIIKDNVVAATVTGMVFCVGLYQFSYWESFSFNPIGILTFQELVTSGIGLLVKSFGVILLEVIFVFWIGAKMRKFKVEMGSGRGPNFLVRRYIRPPSKLIAKWADKRKGQKKRKLFFLFYCILLLVFYVLITIMYAKHQRWDLIVMCTIPLIAVLLFFTVASNISILKPFFKARLSQLIATLIITAVPIVSIGTGILKAVKIKYNIEYDYAYLKYGETQKRPYKILNVGKEDLIVTTLDNKEILIVSREKIDVLATQHFRRQDKSGVVFNLKWPFIHTVDNIKY